MGKREWTSLLAAVMLAACAGDAADDADDAAQDTAPPAATEPAAPPAGGAALPEGVTQAMVAEGKTLFETGVCMACHGVDGSGSSLAPNLRDAEWLNTDGTMDGIINVIKTGVAQPRQYPGPMPALGGGQFTDDQVRALAAYVYSISHGG